MKKEAYIHRLPIKASDGSTVGSKEVISYAGLLDLAHADRLSGISTTLLQAPSKENGDTVIVHATVVTGRGTFSAIGDACPMNVSPRIRSHFIRLGETRAVARALRSALNVGAVALEELGDDITTPPEPPAASASGKEPEHLAEVVPLPPPGPPAKATQDQRRAIYRLLSSRGVDGEQARTFVQAELGVPVVLDATRAAAASLIEKLRSTNGSSLLIREGA